jgi:hypothetical protein
MKDTSFYPTEGMIARIGLLTSGKTRMESLKKPKFLSSAANRHLREGPLPARQRRLVFHRPDYAKFAR